MKKIRCAVTNETFYCNPERYDALLAKYGSEEGINANYVSRQVRIMRKAGKSDDQIRNSIVINNKVQCTVTGEFCYVNPSRREKLVAKAGDEETFQTTFVSRLGKRLLKAGYSQDQIREMSANGSIPEEFQTKSKKQADAVSVPVIEEAQVKEVEPVSEVEENIDAFIAN